MITRTTRRATLEDLYREEGKAELIDGRVIRYMASGYLPSTVAAEIYVNLRAYVKRVGRGAAFPDGIGYAVPELLSGRESFSPDASYYAGSTPSNPMRFIDGPPTLAVEVRSENDYGPAAEADMAAKRADYFAAGTLVIWDVDPVAKTVTRYVGPDAPRLVFRRGDVADAEPAAPGWSMSVEDVFAG